MSQHGSYIATFQDRHLGLQGNSKQHMLERIGVADLETLINETIPESIRMQTPMDLPPPQSEYTYLEELKEIAAKNQDFKSLIGMGFYGTITPSPILRNIFQNPGWYTQYTPYQAEISQGRLEALLNFQTMISDLTGMPMANASLLDEGTAAAEAMLMFYSQKNKRAKAEPANVIWVSDKVLPSTVAVLQNRASARDIEVKIGHHRNIELTEDMFAIVLQYPGANGKIVDYSALIAEAKAKEIYVIVAADLLALTLLQPPARWGADAVVGNTQRFGVPVGCGGPHAAYFATQDEYKRIMPGRIIGVSVDERGQRALRMALQTREQHIKREKATSNICTAQALLAIMAGMYAVYHGPEGLKGIATRIHQLAASLAMALSNDGVEVAEKNFFDTLEILVDEGRQDQIRQEAIKAKYNFYYGDGFIRVSLDETCSEKDINRIFEIITGAQKEVPIRTDLSISPEFLRHEPILLHPVFSSYRTETKLMRYIKHLENKDISLVHAMIPLGSCTMKLNAATELFPVSWEAFANIHPYAPMGQLKGYRHIFSELEKYLCTITGFAACSLQPNSGAQGEYAGLMVIKAYLDEHHSGQRKVALIPESAHGTNPASAVMAGMEVVVVKCDELGNIDLADLKARCAEFKDTLACLMVTYPSTHGVFETAIQEICQLIHDHGGLVYMDGANMNAQVGLTSPAIIGADVCHINLHKTFSIPHGGGGPGMGPICVNEKLTPYLPGHPHQAVGGSSAIPPVASSPWGSASILLISYGYIRMLGAEGMTMASKVAILNANYIKARLEQHYPVVYTGDHRRAAPELILDLRQFKSLNITAEDVAKRLMDYSFHAPTLSFPVAGTLMIEPTESESQDELDRFCDAMIQIKYEIEEIATGQADAQDNVLHNAPHPVELICADTWTHAYGREKAAYPLPYLREGHKFWPSVARVNNGFGDRNLVCTCPPIEAYKEQV